MKAAGVFCWAFFLFILVAGAVYAEEFTTYVDANGVTHCTNIPKDPLYQPKGSVFYKSTGLRLGYADYKDIIKEAADKHQVDPQLVHAVIQVESNYQPYTRSTKGAMGLMQLMPQTAADLQVSNAYDPHENIHGGTKYLRFLLDLFKGDLELSLAGYNAGENAVSRYGGIPPYHETKNYIRKVMELYSPTYFHLPTQPGSKTSFGPAADGKKIYISMDQEGTYCFTNLPPLVRNK